MAFSTTDDIDGSYNDVPATEDQPAGDEEEPGGDDDDGDGFGDTTLLTGHPLLDTSFMKDDTTVLTDEILGDWLAMELTQTHGDVGVADLNAFVAFGDLLTDTRTRNIMLSINTRRCLRDMIVLGDPETRHRDRDLYWCVYYLCVVTGWVSRGRCVERAYVTDL